MPLLFRRGLFRSALCLAITLAGLGLAACSKDEEKGKPLESGALNPPWDSPAFIPRELENLDPEQPDSLFFVFKVIAMIDSLNGDRKSWKLHENAAETVTLSQMMDSAFVFPPSPLAKVPYAYDDTFRDDTLYRSYFGNGLFTQDHPCAQTWLLTEPFLHPARWLKSGLNQARILSALGSPAFSHRGVLRYFSRRMGGVSPEDSTMEGVNFYFRSDSLFAAVLHRSQPCH